jgi:hypothetical protein
MKMNLYLLLYNRVGILNLGDARGIKVRNFLGSLYEFVLGGGCRGVTQLMLGVTEKLKDWEAHAAG